MSEEKIMGLEIFTRERFAKLSPAAQRGKARILEGMDKSMFSAMLIAARTQVSGVKGGGLPIYWEGPPGCAKTAQVKQFCSYFDLQPITLIMGNTPSVDIGGLVAPDFEKGELVHMVTNIFTPNDDDLPPGKVGWFIFLDELSNAQNLEQTACLSIIEEREHGGKPLANNVIMGAAGNRVQDGTGSNRLIESLVDRFQIVPVGPDWKQWLKWASLNDVHPWSQAFVGWKKHAAFPEFEPDAEAMGHPSQRSYFKLSEWLKAGGEKLKDANRARFMAGIIGTGMASEFNGFIGLGMDLPSVDDIIRNPARAKAPIKGSHAADQQYVLMYNIAAHFQKLEEIWIKEKDTNSKAPSPIFKEDVEAIITYFERFPEDMAVFGFTECTERCKEFSKKTPMWTAFQKKHEGMSI